MRQQFHPHMGVCVCVCTLVTFVHMTRCVTTFIVALLAMVKTGDNAKGHQLEAE